MTDRLTSHDTGPMPLGDLFVAVDMASPSGGLMTGLLGRVVGDRTTVREFIIAGRQTGKTACTDALLAVETTPVENFQGCAPGLLGRVFRGTTAHLPIPLEPVSRRRARRLCGRARGART